MVATTANIQTAIPSNERVSAKKLIWAAPLSGAIAAALNTVVYFIYTAIGFNIVLPLPNPTDPTQSSTPLLLAFVVIFSFLPALAAGVLLWLLSKFTRRPVTYFTVISVIVLFVSFGLSVPLDMPAVFKVGLDVMHVVAAIAIIGGLRRFARES